MSMLDLVGCSDLGETGVLDIAGCCEICHSADVYSMVRVIGPCRVALAGGGEAFVCCSGKRILQMAYDPDQGPPSVLPDERGVEA